MKFPLRPSDILSMRRRQLSALGAGHSFDVLVIGGGIFGAGVARDAALRGLRVALIDKGDFASGTSSRSSKLIHGGFRYLEQGSLRLVMEACRERHILQRIAPHLVRPLPFLLPVYRGDARSLGKARIGMTLYDMLALYRNAAPHRCLAPAATLDAEPGLARRNLLGSIRYYDCQEDDARFCLENILHAAEVGATCVNYCELAGLVMDKDRLVAATVRDTIGDQTFDICARMFVNAAGPWMERVAGLVPSRNGDRRSPMLRPTKGIHVVLPRLTGAHAIAFQAPRDGRIMFVLPWHDGSIAGTTDTDFRGDLSDVNAEADDVEYVLSAVRAILPGAPAESSDVITTFAGIRPLLNGGGGGDAGAAASWSAHPSSSSREWRIIRHAENFLSIAGGKYTTYRATAERVVDAVAKMLDARVRKCETADTPLPNRRPSPAGERLADRPSVYESDILHACQAEMAMTVDDVMRRRTPLALTAHGGNDTAAAVARIMSPLMNWSEREAQASLQHYIAGRNRDRSSSSGSSEPAREVCEDAGAAPSSRT